MIKLIVTADDYGMNSNCTKAITECMLKGWVTNTSLMVNMPSCEEAVEQARKNGLLDRIGLHVNFTEGLPLTARIRACREFCDENGEFNRTFRRDLKRCFTPLSEYERQLVEEETVAQVERYIKLGLPVRHFDSHHHSHLVYRVIPSIFKVMREHGFKSVRRPVNLAIRPKLKSKIYYALEEKLKLLRMGRRNMVYTDYMGALSGLQSQFGTIGEGQSAELMVHPMFMKDGKLDMNGEMSDSGLRPLAETVGFLESISNKTVKVSFRDLQLDNM